MLHGIDLDTQEDVHPCNQRNTSVAYGQAHSHFAELSVAEFRKTSKFVMDEAVAVTQSQNSGWVSFLLAPTPLAFASTLIIALSIPLILHFVIYRSSSTTSLPSFLLLGPSNSGKTSLLTLVSFSRGLIIGTTN